VREYIIKHGGELEVAKCAEELNLTKEEVRAAIDVLVERGVLEVERGPEPGVPLLAPEVLPEKPPAAPPEKPPRVGLSRVKLGVILIAVLAAVALVAVHFHPPTEVEIEKPVGRYFEMGYYVKHGENEGRIVDYRLTEEEKWEYLVEFSEGGQTWTTWVEQEKLTRAPDFTLKLSTRGNAVEQGGGTLRVRVWVENVEGYTETVSLRAENLPPGVNMRFEPGENVAPFESSMYVNADENARLTEVNVKYETVQIIATGADGKVHTAEYIMKVVPRQNRGWAMYESIRTG
jgi:hypothetical protein